MILRVVANTSSPHVRTWLRTLWGKFDLVVYDINGHDETALDGLPIKIIRPLNWGLRHRFKAVQYIILGLWLRFQKFDGVIHAHNTSGYGLSAWLSGKSYIVTTYGTEIFQAKRRGLLYRWMIGRVLARSAMITASTPYMATALERDFSVSAEKIFCKMLIEDIFIESEATVVKASSRTWFVNRRMTELYCTLDVVSAFREFLNLGGLGNLVVMEGDADSAYAERVALAIDQNPSIRIIKGFIHQTELIRELRAAHFVVSVPISDQLSSSILEGAACLAVPIVRDLPSYRPLSPICITVDAETGLTAGLIQAFCETSRIPEERLEKMATTARAFVLDNFSPSTFREEFSRRVHALA